MKLQHIGPNETEVTFNNGTIIFFSYNDPVCAFSNATGWVKTSTPKSKTTNRHINDFIVRKTTEQVRDVDQSVIDNLVGSF